MLKSILFPKTEKQNAMSIITKMTVLSLFLFFSLLLKELIFVALALSIIVVSLEKDINGLYYIIFLVAFRYIFRNSLNGQIPFLAILVCYYIIFYLIKTIFVKKEKIKINWWIVGVSLLFVSYIAIPLHDFIFQDFVSDSIGVILIYFVFLVRDKIEYKKLIMFFSMGFLIATTIGLFTQTEWSSPVFFKTLGYVESYGYERFRGLLSDPNFLAFDLIVSMTGLIVLYCKNEIKKYILYPAFFLFFTFGFITYSKSFVLTAFLVCSIFFVCVAIKNKKQVWKDFICFAFAFGLSIFVLEVCFKSNIFVIFGRFSGDVGLEGGENSSLNPEMDAVLTGRWTLWANHIKFLTDSAKNLFFGAGVGNYIKPMEAHNTYIQILFEIGLFGSLIIIALIILYVIFLSKERKKKFNLENYLPLLCFILLIGNYNYFGTMIFPYYIILISFTVRYKGATNNNGKKTC